MMYRLIALSMIALLLPSWVRAQNARPQTRPALAVSIDELRRAYLGLASADPSLRQRAHQQLLSLKRRDLPALAQAVGGLWPADPVLMSTLKEIVLEVHCSGDEYESDPIGFIGIRMDPSRTDVMVENRMIGFSGHRMLRDGDIIVNIEERPLNQEGSRESFIAAVKYFRPGQTIHLSVLRHGQLIRVPVTLDARPADKTGGNPLEYDGQVKEMLYKRTQAAERYWREQFEPLLARGAKPQAAAR